MRIAMHDYAGFSFPLELSIEFSKKRTKRFASFYGRKWRAESVI